MAVVRVLKGVVIARVTVMGLRRTHGRLGEGDLSSKPEAIGCVSGHAKGPDEGAKEHSAGCDAIVPGPWLPSSIVDISLSKHCDMPLNPSKHRD